MSKAGMGKLIQVLQAAVPPATSTIPAALPCWWLEIKTRTRRVQRPPVGANTRLRPTAAPPACCAVHMAVCKNLQVQSCGGGEQEAFSLPVLALQQAELRHACAGLTGGWPFGAQRSDRFTEYCSEGHSAPAAQGPAVIPPHAPCWSGRQAAVQCEGPYRCLRVLRPVQP